MDLVEDKDSQEAGEGIETGSHALKVVLVMVKAKAGARAGTDEKKTKQAKAGA